MEDCVDWVRHESIPSLIPSRRASGLWTLAYCSRMTVPLSDDALAGMAIHADARNRTLGVVGVLFIAGVRFLQVLEGERAAVSWLYDLIAEDPRHRRVTRLLDMPIERRAFDGWPMRLVCDADLADEARTTVLGSLETARVLDADENASSWGLGNLHGVPAALAKSVLGAGRASRPANAGLRLAS